MKATVKNVGRLVAGCGLACCLTLELQAQTNLQFTSINATPEHAIQLHWTSNSNAIYEIDYADSLTDTNTGSITWHKLYDEYPSQGTNTFCLDTGNYDDAIPPIPHPKFSPMRFYRVVMTGTNTGPSPTVIISYPTNGEVLSGNVTVVVHASSTQMLVDTALYVDGQEMLPSDDGTNFIINTCEWWNGTHTLFAVAKSQSGLGGLLNSGTITYGYTASSYVTVTFSNLISELAFSQPFFEPSLGQTQQVTANFAANCDWTLQIQDVNSNTVRTVTGSGDSMTFDWDGTGDGGASLPNGVYHYVVSAQINGLTPQNLSSGNDISASDQTPELWAMPTDGPGDAVPLAIYPPGYDTNDLTIFSASPLEMQVLSSALSTTPSVQTENASPAYSGPSSQSTTGPVRPPIDPVRGSAGTFGIAYQSYAGGFSISAPTTGWPYPLPVYVQLENYPYGSRFSLDPVPEFKSIAKKFSMALQHNGWKPTFILGDDQLSANNIKKASLGGDSIFNSVDIGLLMGHGSYGSTPEDDNVKYSYFFLGSSAHSPTYLRLADFDFGSSAQDGLKWMTILACNMLNPTAVSSMESNFRMPINDNLHILLGCTTVAYGDPKFGYQYGSRLTGGVFGVDSVRDAWFLAGEWTYAFYSLNQTVTFGAIGWPACLGENVYAPNSPDPGSGLLEIDQNVYTP